MSDAHLSILRTAARNRQQQFDDHRAEPGENPRAARARRAHLERLAIAARGQLTRAVERRKRTAP
jgi:hypothetical protein